MQKFSGEYLTAKIQTDYPGDKVSLINEMIGKIEEILKNEQNAVMTIQPMEKYEVKKRG